MNEVKVNELIKLNSDYYAGASQDILYRCSLLGPFILSISSEYLNVNKDSLIKTYFEWLDTCDAINLDIVESLIQLYSVDTIDNKPLKFYEEYTVIFERMVDYLLGKVMWTPPQEKHIAAVNCANNLTAQVLTDIYSKY